jgi:hypothetical protein
MEGAVGSGQGGAGVATEISKRIDASARPTRMPTAMYAIVLAILLVPVTFARGQLTPVAVTRPVVAADPPPYRLGCADAPTRQCAAAPPFRVDSTDARMRRAGIRALSAAVGLAAGSLVGVYGISSFGPDDLACSDVELCQAAIGVLIGGSIGTIVGGAIPSLGSRCGFPARLGLSAIGTALGAAAGTVAAFGTPGPVAPIVLAASIPLGSGLAQWRC